MSLLAEPPRAARPASAQVYPTSAPPPSSSSSRRHRERASHNVSATPEEREREREREREGKYRDVYSHPAAVAFATAHPGRAIPKFGPYLLLQTLGEGEFGKVKLGLHTTWGEEAAVKLIKRHNIDSAVRMGKVEREIEVLRMLKHPNIVRLYDVIETDKYIGIILDYASGGELFDFILAHRYLKEKDACKLFAQLISGVWYIHERKIVHRDLKLENLLLDRNRNVIITDFGFANRFEHRADDLMQTSCGSPCYAAPELVISEGSYVGSAVDIWSCGVILYAMLAGYLPFDDDPANPDGDNINLLYKYIVNTPLSFPDYISPEARDLLQIMLQPDPQRRASLHQVMQHPWLAPYAHLFEKSVEELEQIAVDLHKQKRMQYQRQMRAAHSSRKQQPEYLYEASPEPAAQTSSSRRAAASAIVMPSAPPAAHDDDPFAPGPGLLPQPVAESPVMENETPRRSKASEHPPATGSTRGKRDVRHTIQVEYNQPEDEGQQIQQSQSRPGTATRSKTAPVQEHMATPTKQRRASQQGTPAPPPKDMGQPNPTVTIDHASPPPTPAPAVDISVSTTSSSAPVRQPSKSSSGGGSGRHRRGLSIDKIGLGKIFTSPSSERVERESASRRPSTLSVGPTATPTTPSRNGGNFTRDASFASTQTADSGREREKEKEAVIPDKKSRRSTLSALANPLGTLGGTFRRSVTARTSAREAFAPQDQEKQPHPPTSAPPSSYMPPAPSPGPGILTNGANNTLPPSSSLAVPGGAPAVPGSAQDAPASSTKARRVMQWFRTRSKGADELTDDGMSTHTAASRGYGASNTSVNQIPGSGYSTGPSASFLGASKTPKAPKTGGALRVHHGAVDQTTITSEAPPLVMARVRATLASLGIEAQDESEFKIRCVRPKRRTNVAAVRMVGSAASGGVDRRTGLPVPGQGGQGSIVGSTGGMLRGLLGRRGSSQIVDDSADVSASETSLVDSSIIYGDPSADVGDEVRFYVELTRIDRLDGTYSLDIRRLKGNLRSYKFLYDTVRDRVGLQR